MTFRLVETLQGWALYWDGVGGAEHVKLFRAYNTAKRWAKKYLDGYGERPTRRIGEEPGMYGLYGKVRNAIPLRLQSKHRQSRGRRGRYG